jgi:hypothetical protein
MACLGEWESTVIDCLFAAMQPRVDALTDRRDNPRMSSFTEIPIEAPTDDTDESIVAGKRIALVGRLGAMNRRETANILRSFAATVVELDDESIDWVVIGAEESPLAESDLLSQSILDAAAVSSLEIMGESELWQRLGLVEAEQSIRRYHTRFDHARSDDAQASLFRFPRSCNGTPFGTVDRVRREPQSDRASIGGTRRSPSRYAATD